MAGQAKVVLVVLAGCLLFLAFNFFFKAQKRTNFMDVASTHFKFNSTQTNFPQRRLLGYRSFSEETKRRFQSLLDRNAPADDQELVAFVRTVIDSPSPHRMIKMSRPLVTTPQAEEVDKILDKKKNGFFVEAGALDGERSSNSIFFETQRSWSGLLVEPDPYFYTQLIGKNRNSWSINACLSISPFVSEINFKEHTGGHGKLVIDSSSEPNKVPCFPLETLLLAINVSKIDFFSLDVEGFELQVLKTIPLNRVSISTLAVEYLHGNENDYLAFMESNGFKKVKKIHDHRPDIALYVDDFIFVKNS